MKIFLPKKIKGFTLVELLVVIGILSVLLAIVLIAINPARQFAQANDTQRRSDVNAILNAIHEYAADNKGALPPGILTTSQIIKTGGADICSSLVSTYLAALPVDPTGGSWGGNCSSAYNTGYSVIKSSADNRITVTATLENPAGSPFPVTR